MTREQRELLEIKEKLRLGGGDKAMEKQHSLGKRTARERLELLFDEGTFTEMGLFVKHHAAAFGMGKRMLLQTGL